MNHGYYSSLVTLPVVVKEPGFYRTRCDEVVEIKMVSARNDFGCVGIYPSKLFESWHRSGRLLASRETANDIVSKVEGLEHEQEDEAGTEGSGSLDIRF